MTPPAPPIDPRVWTYLAWRGTPGARVTPLTGDASTRRYLRVDRDGDPSFIIALYPEPFDPQALPFLNVARLFARLRLPIPAVRDVAGHLGIVALEDLGDVTLQAHLAGLAPADALRWYEQAVDLIVQLQQRAAAEASPAFLPYGLAFDEEKLTWELDFFTRHFLEAHRGIVLDAATRDALAQEWHAMAAELAAEPRVVCHRDYHSRNLMVQGHRLVLIDFQDARMGPDTYDLVSLLRDSYVRLPGADVDRLVARFLAAPGRPAVDPAAFRARFTLMALQRNLKALGTFGYQMAVAGRPQYAESIPPTLAYVREHLAAAPRFARLQGLLAPHLPELR
ncbi:MAG: phosphotransferase [Acidobacteriota bacterium]|nr:phosphotransferase [Acidobacteriota bacterium]